MPRLNPDDALVDGLAQGRAAADPEPRREQQRAQAERRAADHQQADTGRHDEDRSRPASYSRKMH
jgi:hypothetical protein